MKYMYLYILMLLSLSFIITGCEKSLSYKIEGRIIDDALLNISDNDHWYGKIITNNMRNTAIVNASNESTTYGGGGINGALEKYFTFKGQQSWGQLYTRHGKKHEAGTQVAAGDFVYSKHSEPIAFDWQLHAVGPRRSSYKTARESNNFKSARILIQDLIYNILEFCNKNNIENIVITAISTALFADNDEEFKNAMYDGMSAGIIKFLQIYKADAQPQKIYLPWRKEGIARFNENLRKALSANN
jgi:O-acetyl-ADP-ribose deacetylase (regulator of RNase III)